MVVVPTVLIISHVHRTLTQSTQIGKSDTCIDLYLNHTRVTSGAKVRCPADYSSTGVPIDLYAIYEAVSYVAQ